MRTLLLLTLLLVSAPARAQTELEQARASLHGVDHFYLSVNVEGPAAVVADSALGVPALTARIAARLREAGLPLRTDAGIPAADRLPYLHVHVNAMQADRGQIPFAVKLRFYQAVRLERAPSRILPAATWDAGLVGLTYHTAVGFVADVAADEVETFIDEFRRAHAPQ
ncbi:MAG: hypothetical protein R3247_05280 [Rhodothermales bacterium]|nr:hypothetical protein [Rhodothermales bacterium]